MGPDGLGLTLECALYRQPFALRPEPELEPELEPGPEPAAAERLRLERTATLWDRRAPARRTATRVAVSKKAGTIRATRRSDPERTEQGDNGGCPE